MMPITAPTTTTDLVLDELEKSAAELLQYGEHEGECTNSAQKALFPKIPPCKKHLEAAQKRRRRFENALDQVKLLRGMMF